MNVKNPEVQPKICDIESKGDSAKLLSLLALATGAVAMPQASNADIVFTDLSANPVHVGPQANSAYSIANLPGTAQFGFHTQMRSTLVGSSRWITARQQGGYVRLKSQAPFVAMANAGKTWNQVGGVVTSNGTMAAANDRSSAGPASYNDKYLLFRFRDSTQAGNPFLYGWIEISLANPAGGNGPDIAIEGYAYDTTGAFAVAGQVPEPSATALLALGALTLGAKGLRNWRKNQKSEAKASA